MQSTQELLNHQRDAQSSLSVQPSTNRYSVLLIMMISVCLSACDSESSSSETSMVSAGEQVSGEMMGGENATPENTLPRAIFEPSDRLPDTPLASVPFPHDLYRSADQKLDLTGFPNQSGVLAQLIDEIENATLGFGTTSGLFLAFQSQIDVAQLPADGGESLRDDASLALIDIDPNSPELGRRWPIYWRYALLYQPTIYSFNLFWFLGLPLCQTDPYSLV